MQLVDKSGDLRDWHYDPNPNTAKWRWVDTLPWKGPCSHDSQLSYGHFFFFKTSTRYGDCSTSNYENSVYDPDTTSYTGFINRDSTLYRRLFVHSLARSLARCIIGWLVGLSLVRRSARVPVWC